MSSIYEHMQKKLKKNTPVLKSKWCTQDLAHVPHLFDLFHFLNPKESIQSHFWEPINHNINNIYFYIMDLGSNKHMNKQTN